jgi:hypothetical protein
MTDIKTNLAAALAKAHAEFPSIKKDKTVKVATKTGGSYTFAYAPLDSILSAVRPVLANHGLSVMQTVDGDQLVSVLVHESGETLMARCSIIFERGTAQEYGSSLTYARRYSISLLLNLCPDEDEDGNLASGHEATVVRDRTVDPITEAQHNELHALVESTGKLGNVLAHYRVKAINELSTAQAAQAIKSLVKVQS